MYVFFDDYGIKNYNHIFVDSLFSNFTYTLHSEKGKTIEIGDIVKFYIVKEIGNLKRVNEFIEINSKTYKYLGRNPDTKSRQLEYISAILNESKTDFLECVDNIVLFDGFIDFDIEN